MAVAFSGSVVLALEPPKCCQSKPKQESVEDVDDQFTA